MKVLRREPGGGSLPARTEIVLTSFNESDINEEKIARWKRYFDHVRVAAVYPRNTELVDDESWIHFDEIQALAPLWNQFVSTSQSEFVLFLMGLEDVLPDNMPPGHSVTDLVWAPVLTSANTKNGTLRQFYQMRFVPVSAIDPFEGKNLPDCTSYIFENEISLSESPAVIESGELFIERVKPEEELSVKSASPQVYLIQAEQLMETGKYAQAGALYKKLLRREHLLPFDRLAAVNGLAASYAEQFRWEKAAVITQQSADAEPFQRMPYLIQYKVHELNKRWKEAFSAMQNYYLHINQVSRANFDRTVGKEEALRILGRLALKLSDNKNALRYLDLLRKEAGVDDDRELIGKLLNLSIETSNYEKSLFYFGLLYNEWVPDKLSAEMSMELNSHLAMFMEQGWYEYPCELYRELYRSDRSNQEYRRRLIVSLTKTNQLENARRLIAEAV